MNENNLLIAKDIYFSALKENINIKNIEFENYLKEKLGVSVLNFDKDNIMVTLHWNGGRGWDSAEETFICPKDEWHRFKNLALGNECYLGEIAGKHSEIYGPLENSDIIENNILDYGNVGYNYSLLSGMGSYFESHLDQNSDDYKFVFDFIDKYGGGY